MPIDVSPPSFAQVWRHQQNRSALTAHTVVKPVVTIIRIQFGTNEASPLRQEMAPVLVVYVPFSQGRSYLPCNILPADCVSSTLSPKFNLDLSWVRLRFSRGNAAYERANGSNSGSTSATMNAVFRERLTDTADADTVAQRFCMRQLLGLEAPTYCIQTSTAIPSMLLLAAPLTRKEYTVHRLPSDVATCMLVDTFAVTYTIVNASFPFYPPSTML